VIISSLKIIFDTKHRIINNWLDDMKSHLWMHLLMGGGVLGILVGGGSVFFFVLFDFLVAENFQPFGELLLDHLMGMIFLAFFSMLVFSNIIITLSTTYISKELDFYMALPIRFRDLFVVKLVESMIYSSWAFAILALPIFISYGAAKKTGLSYYFLSVLLVIPYIIIPATIGAIVTMLISAFLPAKKTRLYSIFIIAGIILISVASARILGFRRLFSLSDVKDFTQIMNFLKVGNKPIFPNYWITKGMIAAGEGNFKEWAYWLCILISNALMLLQICWWLVPPLYYKGWCLAKETSRQGTAGGRFSILDRIDSFLKFLPSRARALVSKDIKTFWRDPAQWSQIIILFGLLFIYIANLRSAARYSGTINIYLPKWQTILSFFNLGATCFILSIITTRFTYPMLSLEGRQFWVVGLAPMDRNYIVWEKYWLSSISALIVAEIMMMFSNYILKVDSFIMYLSAATVFIMSFGLTSLAVGLGAIFPNFREDNPARIANGLGGTLNVILSLIYTGAIIAFEMFPVYLHATGGRSLSSWPMIYSIPYIFAFILLNAFIIIQPMRTGLKKWKMLEM
jgi:ABC-2 type transport system permease protein